MPSSPPPNCALLAEVSRGGIVESRHYGHAVAVDVTGRVLWAAGNPEHPTIPRSSLKPLQALAGVSRGTASRYGFSPAELAVTCASHAAEPRHRAAVARILERIDATEDDLHCGPHPVPDPASRDELIREGREPTRIYSNCSGKHAGMLALARLLGAPLAGYWEPDHPVQLEIQQVLRVACDVRQESLEHGIDGCGVPTYLLSLRRLALGFARLARPESLGSMYSGAATVITAAMMAEPEMVRGKGGFDSVLMQELPGQVFSKGGAEGCQCVGLAGHGIGIAVKVEDGASRPLPPLTLSILRRLDALPGVLPAALRELVEPVVLNTRGAPVGSIKSYGCG